MNRDAQEGPSRARRVSLWGKPVVGYLLSPARRRVT